MFFFCSCVKKESTANPTNTESDTMKTPDSDHPVNDATENIVVTNQALTTADKAKTDQDFLIPLVFNPERYRDYLDDCDLTEEQQNELLQALWNIMYTMVDIGFGLDSVQLFFDKDEEKTGADSVNSIKKKVKDKDTEQQGISQSLSIAKHFSGEARKEVDDEQPE